MMVLVRGNERRTSDEGLKHAQAVRDERSAVSDTMRPIGIGDQRSSYRHKVEVSALQPCKQGGEVVFGQAALAAHHLGHRVVERDRADGDRRLSRQLLRPGREIYLRAELTFPISTLGQMECIDAGPREGTNDSSPFFRIGREPRAIILLLPGRQPQRYREIRPDIRADLLNDLGAETGSAADVAAILVLAQVGLIPEKLIDEVAMRAVNFDAVKAQRLCVAPGT